MKDNKNINEEKRIPIKSLLGTFIMILIVVIGGTFAWYTYQSNKSALVLNIGDLNSRVIIKPYQINDIMVPVNNYTSGVNSQVSVINESADEVEVVFFYRINELASDLVNNGLKYTIVSSSTKNGEYSHVSTGNFTGVGSLTEFDIFNVMIPANTSIYYKVYLWLDTNFGDQSSIQNLNIDMELNARYSLLSE